MKFEKHIFICVNQRTGTEKLSCGETKGLELVAAFKKEINDLKLPTKIRAQKAGCLDVCNYGPTVVVYPEGVFYIGVELTDVKEIVTDHIVNNKPVKRLILDKSKY